jgi:hypothetical protein
MERRLRRSWHRLRRRLGADIGAPVRLVVDKAPWLHDARSPAMLMVDDLTNAWHSAGPGDRWEHGGDWGGGLDAPDSAMRLLEDRLLREYPEARVTFFTVAGPISAYTRHQPFSYSAPLDASPASAAFFQRMADDPRFELAYHGHNHGTPGERTETFLQEWRGFPSVEAAVAQTARGLETFRRTIGRAPAGGKYGGWEYNEWAEPAIDASGFLWWCRDWMPRDIAGRIPDEYYEPQFFGRNLVVALPSTLHGHFWDTRQVDLLLARRQVIAIEEHIAPVRPDGLVQTPNIVDDLDDLRRLYGYLRSKGGDVWHATGTQIASYVIARERTLIYDVTRDGFSVRYDGRVERPMLTLRLDARALGSGPEPFVDVITPGGEVVRASPIRAHRERYRHLATVPVEAGRYRVRSRAASSAEGGR